MMSRITKLPVSTSKKENRPGLLNSRAISKTTTVNGLSDNDKRTLIMNHTKPLRSEAGPSSTVAAPRLKRSATAPSVACKVAKVEKKTVAAKIPPYAYKERFTDLLEKHKVMKSEYTELKEKHGEIADDYEKIQESLQSCSNERDILKDKLLNSLNDLRAKSTEFDKVKVDFEIQKHENENLQRKAKLLEEITVALKQKSSELDNIQSEFENLTQRHNSLKEETEALRVLTEQLKKISIEYDKMKLDFKEAQETIQKYKSDAEALQNILGSMYKEQRDLRNKIQDLKGNIRVYCRVRPPFRN